MHVLPILSISASYHTRNLYKVFWWFIQIFSKALPISQFVSNFKVRFWHHRFIIIASCIQPGPIPKFAIKLMKRSNRTASLNALFAFQSVQPKQIYSHVDWDSYMGFQEPTEKKGCRGELIMLINKLTPKRLKGSRFRKQNGELWACAKHA